MRFVIGNEYAACVCGMVIGILRLLTVWLLKVGFKSSETPTNSGCSRHASSTVFFCPHQTTCGRFPIEDTREMPNQEDWNCGVHTGSWLVPYFQCGDVLWLFSGPKELDWLNHNCSYTYFL